MESGKKRDFDVDWRFPQNICVPKCFETAIIKNKKLKNSNIK